MLNIAGYLAGGGGAKGNYAYEVMKPVDGYYQMTEFPVYGTQKAYYLENSNNVLMTAYFGTDYTFDEETGEFTLSENISTQEIALTQMSYYPPVVSGKPYAYVIFGGSSGRQMFIGTSNSSYRFTISRNRYMNIVISDNNNYLWICDSRKKQPTETDYYITEKEEKYPYFGTTKGVYYALPNLNRASFSSTDPNDMRSGCFTATGDSISVRAGSYDYDDGNAYYVSKNGYYWYVYKLEPNNDEEDRFVSTQIFSSEFNTSDLNGVAFHKDGAMYCFGTGGFFKMPDGGTRRESIASVPQTGRPFFASFDGEKLHLVNMPSETLLEYYTYSIDEGWTLVRTHENTGITSYEYTDGFIYNDKIYGICRIPDRNVIVAVSLKNGDIEVYDAPNTSITKTPFMIRDNIIFVFGMGSSGDYMPNAYSVFKMDLEDGLSYWGTTDIASRENMYGARTFYIPDKGIYTLGYYNSSGSMKLFASRKARSK